MSNRIGASVGDQVAGLGALAAFLYGLLSTNKGVRDMMFALPIAVIVMFAAVSVLLNAPRNRRSMPQKLVFFAGYIVSKFRTNRVFRHNIWHF
ncbi:MAG: hypothetical protein COA47_06075 [Robiginitomaculum sp.]|nr:MAG: hypothetical protein COA47_06075 [Robiginitomaculum sp.]